jgi:hypothetical protein
MLFLLIFFVDDLSVDMVDLLRFCTWHVPQKPGKTSFNSAFSAALQIFAWSVMQLTFYEDQVS